MDIYDGSRERFMSLLKKNIIANFSGNIWQALMGLAFVPIYIRFMGVESYGLVGIFAILQGMVAILDMGIGATLTREMARLSVLPGKEQEMRDLLRSLEILYWAVAVIIGIAVVAVAPFVAYHWVQPGQLSPDTIKRAIMMMGFAMAFQWPGSFYLGGLVGLQKQVLLNVINAAISTLRGVGAIFILWLVSPTIQAFFVWQIVISILGTCCLGFFLWKGIPCTEGRPVFRKKLLEGVWKFAAGMTGISVLGMILTQLDKIILSKMLSLEIFGYYTIAGTVAISLYRLIGPVFSAVYPRMTQLVSIHDSQGVKDLYHKSCQFMSVLILPVAIIISMFSFEIILLWTRNPLTAEKTHLVLSVLVLGTALNGLMNIPYALQLAYGWTRLSLYVNTISVILLVPLIFFLTGKYGAVGGASAWAILNSGYCFIVIPLVHKRLLPNENGRWYGQDVGIPLLVSLCVAGLGRSFVTAGMPQLVMISLLAGISLATALSAVIATTTTRMWLWNKIGFLRSIEAVR